MLVGSYQMSVDSKGRVTLPADFRKDLVSEDSREITLVPFDGCVYGFTPEGFEQWVPSLFERGDRHYDPRNRDDVRLRRGLYGRAKKVEVDSAGRMAIGKLGERCESLGLTGDVMVVGGGDHIEVWNAVKWQDEQDEFDQDLDSLMFGC